jgi:ABC-type branched-subunit amino acid transport system ATPase component
VAWGQVNAIAQAMLMAARELSGQRVTMRQVLDHVEDTLGSVGLDALDHRRPGDLMGFRRFELAAALNRLRSLRVEAVL